MKDTLPEQFIKGLTSASLQGRAQIVPDQHIKSERSNELVFFLDGAHSPESMEVCALHYFMWQFRIIKLLMKQGLVRVVFFNG